MTKTRDLADLGGGFIQAGTGAVQRTVESKLQDVVSVFDFMTPGQRQSVVNGDMVEDVTVPCQAALTAATAQQQVYFPAGKYKTSAALIAYGGFYGAGTGTIIMPQGNHECFRFLPGTLNKPWAVSSIQAAYVGDLAIQFPGSSDTAGNVAQKGIWINKGVAAAADASCDNVNFRNLYFRNCYNAIYQGAADKGNLWNCSFRDIIILSSKDYGVYLDLTGNNGSLNVSFSNVAIDYSQAPSYSKGAVLNGIANLHFKGIITSRLTSDAAILDLANCTNAVLQIQQENNLMNVPGQRPTMVRNCTSVDMSLVVNTPIVNPGAGNIVNYIYVDDQTRAFILRQFQTVGETITSGSRKVLNAQLGAGSNTKFTILDGSIVRDDLVLSPGQLNNTFLPATNYALQNTPTALRRQTLGITTSAGVAQSLLDLANYGSRVGRTAGLYVVYGIYVNDGSVGFTDLVLVNSSINTQTVTAVSSNNVGVGADARTYSMSGTELQVTIPNNSYKVAITGFDGAGAWGYT